VQSEQNCPFLDPYPTQKISQCMFLDTQGQHITTYRTPESGNPCSRYSIVEPLAVHWTWAEVWPSKKKAGKPLCLNSQAALVSFW
jgi:hypothetical protein